MEKFKLISLNKWEQEYKPVMENGDYKAYPYTSDIPNNVSDYNIWTLLDGDDGVLLIMSGSWLCNRMEHYVTLNPWKEGEQINTFCAGGYELKIEQHYEDIEEMEECIKKGKDLDYYGHTKEEQEDFKQSMFLDDIEYCKKEIENCNEMEKKEFIPRLVE